VAAKDTGLDTSSRSSLNDDFGELRDQITSIVETAEFNGKNIIESGATSLSSITDPSGTLVITVSAQDLTLDGANVTITSTTSISTAPLASSAVALLSASATNVTSALATLGAGSNRLDIQRDFVSALSDTIEVGIGNLVDADLAKESANLQAQQVKQQLGLTALSIANNAPSSILVLFE